MTMQRPPVVVEISCGDRATQGSTEVDQVEVDRDLWEGMSPAQRSAYCDSLAEDMATNRFSWGWNISDPADMTSTEPA